MPPAPDPSAARHVRYGRSNFRARSHDSAHAEEPVAGGNRSPSRADVPVGDAPLVADATSLAELVAHLRAAGRFAYDSEFIGELTYLPKLCLLQVATETRVALIDPLLPGLDLSPFWELLTDPAVEKIVHAGDQDVEPVVRHTGREPANLFDTQIACGFIGMAYPVSLSKLVLEIVGAKLGKGLTFTHWDQRPLSGSQLRYAADDVRYLPAIRNEIGKKLAGTGHEAWAREEFTTLCAAKLYQFDPETSYTRVRGMTSLAAQAVAVLKELTAWRDAAARAHDVPPRAFVKDEILIDLSRQPCRTVDKLDRVRGLPRPVAAAHGQEIVTATLAGLAAPTAGLKLPRPAEATPTERFRADALFAAMQCMCGGLGVDPALVASRQDGGEFYRWLTAGGDEPDIRLMSGWRRTVVAEPLSELVTGARALDIRWTAGAPGATTSP